MNNQKYMSSESVILIENESIFSPVSQLHYSFYDDINAVEEALKNNNNVQCICGTRGIAFGKAQEPLLNDYADQIDTMQFLLGL